MARGMTPPASAGSEPTGLSSFRKVRTLLQGSASSDFTISVLHKGGRWLVSQTDHACPDPGPIFGSGSSFREAWRKAGMF